MSNSRSVVDRLYDRNGRWWADFRDYSDEGGEREGLVPEGERWATKDLDTAIQLAQARLSELQGHRGANAAVPVRAVHIRAFAPRFLQLKARETNVQRSTMTRGERAMKNALTGLVDASGQPIDPFMHQITVKDVRRLRHYLLNVHISPRTGRHLSSRSVRYATDILSECFTYAASEGFVPPGYDPVAGLPKRASTAGEWTDFLEAHEAAAVLDRLIELAGGIDPHVGLCFLAGLSGCRKAGGAGLLTREIDRARGLLVFQSNSWRTIKTDKKGYRTVPIWPQFEIFLEAYDRLFERAPSGLYLPTTGNDGEETMITSVKARLDAAQEAAAELLDAMGVDHQLWDRSGRARPAAGIVLAEDLPPALRDATVDEIVRTPTHRVVELRERDSDPEHVKEQKAEGRRRYKRARAELVDSLDEKRVTIQSLRPTYATARVQTLDGGRPVARTTVAFELGHSSNDMLDRIYARVGRSRAPRKDVVEYRLPDGSLPGEAFFRKVIGSSRYDEILNNHGFSNAA